MQIHCVIYPHQRIGFQVNPQKDEFFIGLPRNPLGQISFHLLQSHLA
jgi:hypothetical protein